MESLKKYTHTQYTYTIHIHNLSVERFEKQQKTKKTAVQPQSE